MAVPSLEFRRLVETGLQGALRLSEPLAALEADLLNRRPNPSEWSVGQCIDHLLLANGAYLGAIESALIGADRSRPERPEYSSSLLGRMMIRAVGPDSKMNVPVPKPLEPTREPVDLNLVGQHTAAIEGLLQQLENSRGLDLARVKITSPFARWMKFQLGDAFKIVEVHSMRHLLQAHRVLESVRSG